MCCVYYTPARPSFASFVPSPLPYSPPALQGHRPPVFSLGSRRRPRHNPGLHPVASAAAAGVGPEGAAAGAEGVHAGRAAHGVHTQLLHQVSCALTKTGICFRIGQQYFGTIGTVLYIFWCLLPQPPIQPCQPRQTSQVLAAKDVGPGREKVESALALRVVADVPQHGEPQRREHRRGEGGGGQRGRPGANNSWILSRECPRALKVVVPQIGYTLKCCLQQN